MSCADRSATCYVPPVIADDRIAAEFRAEVARRGIRNNALAATFEERGLTYSPASLSRRLSGAVALEVGEFLVWSAVLSLDPRSLLDAVTRERAHDERYDLPGITAERYAPRTS